MIRQKYAGVELEALRRTRERDPELLIELSEREQVRGAVQADLIEPARAKESPPVTTCVSCHVVQISAVGALSGDHTFNAAQGTSGSRGAPLFRG